MFSGTALLCLVFETGLLSQLIGGPNSHNASVQVLVSLLLVVVMV